MIITVKYTTTSIIKDILKTDRLTNKDAVPLSRSGINFQAHKLDCPIKLMLAIISLTLPISANVHTIVKEGLQLVCREH